MPTPLKPGETPHLILEIDERARLVELAKEALAGKYHFGEPPSMTIDPGMLLDLLADFETLRAYGDRRGEEERAKALAEGAKERNDLRSKLEGMARSRDKWQTNYESFTQAAGMKPLRVAYLALVEAVRSALHTLQDPMRGFSRRCAGDLPHDHKDLQTVRAAMNLLGAAHDAAVEVIQPRSLAAAPSGDAPVEAIRDTTGEPEPSLRSLASDAIAQAYAKGRAEMAERAAQIAEFDGAQGTANTVRSIIEAPSGDAKGTK